MRSIRCFPSYRIPKEDMDQFTVDNGFDAVKSSPHTETSQLWNLGWLRSQPRPHRGGEAQNQPLEASSRRAGLLMQAEEDISRSDYRLKAL